MSRGLFNSDQESWMRYLASLPESEKCACGWERKTECHKTASCEAAEKRRAVRAEPRKEKP